MIARTTVGVVAVWLAVALSTIWFPLVALATPTVGKPIVSPTVVAVGQATDLTVTSTIARLATDPPVLANGVNLLRVDNTGKTLVIVGVMHDDGLAGDAVAGDGVFTLRFTTTEATPGQLRLQISAAFQKLLKRLTSAITSVTINSIPIANAGADRSMTLNQVVQLDGSTSSDMDGDELTFHWTLLSKPAGSTAALSSTTLVNPTFTIDKAGTYEFQLVVDDGSTNSAPDTVKISTTNSAPTADAGPDQTVKLNRPVTLDGSKSSDPDGDTLTYQWTLVTFKVTVTVGGGGGSGGYAAGSTKTCYSGPAGSQGVGICKAGTQTCGSNGTFGACVGEVLPGTEIPGNAVDENCDGVTPECSAGATRSCYSSPAGTEGVGICKSGTQTCGSSGTFGSCTGQVVPGPEIPNNGIDEDCNGADLTTGGTLPPDPKTVAPAVALGVATTIGAATQFLYTGSNLIQTGVTVGTIEPRRAAVIRGKVLDRSNAPLSGVKITVLNHSEFGQTLSRADGMFDLAVNGGGLLSINYDKIGFLPSQRQLDVPWQDFALAPDVILIAKDTQVTTIDPTSSTPMQVARGNVVTDSDGTRRATVLIPQGTQAQVLLPNGTTQPVSTLNIRLTEYTVGASGPQATPGPLPPTSGYTYALELGADEAIAKIAGKDVLFSQPVFVYSENFLNFPIGLQIPVAYYNKDTTAWVPVPDGRIVKILSITGGAANLDTDGDGTADNGVALGVTNAERQQLASLYGAGQGLWRISVTHFSTYDLNYGVGTQDGASNPNEPGPDGDNKPDDPCQANGSIIECQSQVLGEVVGITGTPYSLHYANDRVPGRIAGNSLRIPLSGNTPLIIPKGIALEVSIAGTLFSQTFPFAPNQTYTFTWDGKDAYGRSLRGQQPVIVRLGYIYQGFYNRPPLIEWPSFGLPSFTRVPGDIPAREDVTLWQEFHETIGSPVDQRVSGIGGWSLNIHHSYDPTANVLYYGDGSRRSAENINAVITTVAGTGEPGFSGDGGPATQAQFNFLDGFAVAPDGSLYIADGGNARIRRVDPAGVITTVAGNGIEGFGGDGGPATQASLNLPGRVEIGTDGSLYIADLGNHRIRRVDTNGVITTIAGTGVPGFSGDGRPATQADLNETWS